MSAITEILGSSYFEERLTKIRVESMEHNGKIWMHKHEFYEFVYVDTGFTLHTHDGRTSVLTPGDLFAIRPNEAHAYTSAYHTKLYNCLFFLEELKGLSDELLILPGLDNVLNSQATEPVPVLHVDLSVRSDLTLLLERMKWEQLNRGIGWELNLKSQLISFLIFYSRLYSSGDAAIRSHNDGYYGYIFKALEFIDQNYQNDLTSRDIAECTGLSHDYVAKQFKNVLSMTPSEYIRRFRVAKSMELLKTTDLSAAEIAKQVGFGDISLFSRVFKQLTGVSPTTFRKNGEL